jgi:hypothetical protein
MFPIASVTITGSAANTITFSGIPQTYTHLQVRTNHQLSAGSVGNGAFYFSQINGSGLSFNHQAYGNGASVFSATDGNMPVGYSNFTNLINTFWSSSIIDIVDYTNTNKLKTVRSISGSDQNGAGIVGVMSLYWNNSAAINSIGFSGGGSNFQVGTRFDLYGIIGTPSAVTP